MSIVLKNNHILIENLFFSDTKKNIIIDGFFTKIIYSDNDTSINGLYIDFPIIFNKDEKNNHKNLILFNAYYYLNSTIIKQIGELEIQILEYYNTYSHISKKIIPSLYNLLLNGKIKLYSNTELDINNVFLFLKISGVWETDDNIGITFKFLHSSVVY
jgi:hypothetical protein